MYELKVSAAKVLGTCTAHPPVEPGEYFTVRDGDIRIPEGRSVCLWALHSLLPLVTPKEREILEGKGEDWMWRVHHAQCPDPNGRVVFKIERVGKVERRKGKVEGGGATEQRSEGVESVAGEEREEGEPRDLLVVVEQVRGKCTSGMRPGDRFFLRHGRLFIPAERHFCLYALQAVLPFLSAKQRHLQDGDWLKDEQHFICPDPAGNVIMRIEQLP